LCEIKLNVLNTQSTLWIRNGRHALGGLVGSGWTLLCSRKQWAEVMAAILKVSRL